MEGEETVWFSTLPQRENSLYVAKQLEEHPVSIAQAIHDKEKVYRAERIGIVCPVFGHEMPELVKDF